MVVRRRHRGTGGLAGTRGDVPVRADAEPNADRARQVPGVSRGRADPEVRGDSRARGDREHPEVSRAPEGRVRRGDSRAPEGRVRRGDSRALEGREVLREKVASVALAATRVDVLASA